MILDISFISFAQKRKNEMGAFQGLITRGIEGREKSLGDALKLQWSFFPDIEV
jgi:hypothetical protein